VCSSSCFFIRQSSWISLDFWNFLCNRFLILRVGDQSRLLASKWKNEATFRAKVDDRLFTLPWHLSNISRARNATTPTSPDSLLESQRYYGTEGVEGRTKREFLPKEFGMYACIQSVPKIVVQPQRRDFSGRKKGNTSKIHDTLLSPKNSRGGRFGRLVGIVIFSPLLNTMLLKSSALHGPPLHRSTFPKARLAKIFPFPEAWVFPVRWGLHPGYTLCARRLCKLMWALRTDKGTENVTRADCTAAKQARWEGW